MGKSVIVLDDDMDLGEVLCAGFDVLGASTSHFFTSVAELQTSEHVLSADLAVIDINLGTGQPTGLDAANWLCNSNFQGRIVFLTGHANNHPLVLAASKRRSIQILQKPTDLTLLAALLED